MEIQDWGIWVLIVKIICKKKKGLKEFPYRSRSWYGQAEALFSLKWVYEAYSCIFGKRSNLYKLYELTKKWLKAFVASDNSFQGFLISEVGQVMLSKHN